MVVFVYVNNVVVVCIQTLSIVSVVLICVVYVLCCGVFVFRCFLCVLRFGGCSAIFEGQTQILFASRIPFLGIIVRGLFSVWVRTVRGFITQNQLPNIEGVKPE